MNRTSNDLLQRISNHIRQSVQPPIPANHSLGRSVEAALVEQFLQAAAQFEPRQVESLVEQFGSELSPEEMLAAAESLLGNEMSLDETRQRRRLEGTESSEPIPQFAKDPYVADSDDGVKSFSSAPKTIEEILQSISGYQVDNESEGLAETKHELDSTADPTGEDGVQRSADEQVPRSNAQAALDHELVDTSNASPVVDPASDSFPGDDALPDPLDELSQPEFHVEAFIDALEAG